MDFWDKLQNLLPHPFSDHVHSSLAFLARITGLSFVKFIPPVTVPILAFLVMIILVLTTSANLRQKATP